MIFSQCAHSTQRRDDIGSVLTVHSGEMILVGWTREARRGNQQQQQPLLYSLLSLMMTMMMTLMLIMMMTIMMMTIMMMTFERPDCQFCILAHTCSQISIIWRTNQSGSFLICIFPPTSRSTNRSGRILGWELFNLWEIWSEGSQAHKSISRTRGIAKGLQSFTILDHL